jgi:glyoxylase-like metal-dependent hydrolase (beta-lactamase superfamily II)
VDATLPEDHFQPPRDFVAVVNSPDGLAVQKLSDTLYLIRGSYNVLFEEFHDHVVVFEGPASSSYAEECLELIRATLPGKPIRTVMSTHYHYDHIAGLRVYIAAGIPIIATPDAKEVIERLAASRHTMHPDALSRHPRPPVIETVADSRILDDGTARAEIYALGPAPHVAQMLVAYFPKEKLLYVADLMDVLAPELVIAGVDGVAMGSKVKSLGLEIDQFVPVHGAPITGEQFRKAYEIRAKLVH